MVSHLQDKDAVDPDLPSVVKDWLTSPGAQRGLRTSYVKRSMANK
jgi:hypothetical protein